MRNEIYEDVLRFTMVITVTRGGGETEQQGIGGFQ